MCVLAVAALPLVPGDGGRYPTEIRLSQWTDTMATRIMLVFAFATLMARLAFTDDAPTAMNIGDHVAVELTEDAAVKYSRISTRPIADASRNGFTIQIIAELHKASGPANIRLVHHAETIINTEGYRVTLAGTLPANRVVVETSPAGTVVSASPTAAGTPAESEIKTLRVRLNDLEGFKLQRWQLMEEIID